jgi:predicted nuclease with TOPRIM domain
MEINQSIPMIITVISAIGGSYITIRIAIAEIKKDVSYLKEKIESEINSKKELEEEHKNNMKEVRDDVKAIFTTLTKIQIEFAKNQGKNEGRDEVLGVVKDAITTMSKK